MRTSDYIKLCELWERGMTTKDIAEELDMSVLTVRVYIHRHRDEFPHRRHHAGWWKEQLESVKGMSHAEAGRILGCSASTIAHWRRKVAEHAVHGTD